MNDTALPRRVVPTEGEAALPAARAQAWALAGQAPAGYVAAALVAVLVAWAMTPVVPGWRIGLWLAAVLGVTGIRALELRREGGDREAELASPAHLRRHLVWTAASGALWGTLPWLLWPRPDLEYVLIVTLAILGLTAGASVAYAPIRGHFELFATPAVASLAVRLLVDGRTALLTAAAFCPIYLAAMLFLAHKHREDAVALAATYVLLGGELSRRRMEEEVLQERRRLELLTDSIPALISYVTPDHRYAYVNSQYERYFGRSRESFVGSSIRSVGGDDTYARLEPYLDRAMLGEEQWFEFSPAFPDGRTPTFSVHYVPDWADDGTVRGCFALLTEVTEYKETETRLLEEIRRDFVTGLLNRRGFLAAVAEVLGDHRKRPAADFVCFLDLDRFKQVNDRAGHEAGDAALRHVAGVLKDLVRSSDVLARIGGDEFGLILAGCSEEEALEILRRVRSEVARTPFTWNDHRFHLGVSIGAVVIDRGLHRVESLLREADQACYAAKGDPETGVVIQAAGRIPEGLTTLAS